LAECAAQLAALLYAGGFAGWALLRGADAIAIFTEPQVARYRVAAQWIFGIAALLGASLVAVWRRAPGRTLRQLLRARAGWTAAIAILLLPWLCHSSVFLASEILSHLVLLAFGASSLHVAAQLPGTADRGSRARLGWLVTTTGALAFTWYFAKHSILAHYRFETHAFDLGNYEQAFWTTLHGRFLATTYLDGGTFLSHHFSPLLAAPAALYALVPRTETILAFQAASVGLAALPLYGLALRRWQSATAAMALALAYLMLPATQMPVFYDYHDVTMLPLCVFGLLWAAAARRWKTALLCGVATALVKEEGALLAGGLAVYLAASRVAPWQALGGTVCAAIYYVLVKTVVMPWLSGGAIVHLHYYGGLIPPDGHGASALGMSLVLAPYNVLQRVFTEPKLLHLLRLTAPLLLLPLLARRNMWALAVPLAIVFLATWWPVTDFSFQYNYYLLPILLGVLVITPLGARLSPKRVAVVVLLLASLQNLHYGFILQRDQNRIRFGGKMRFDFDAGDEARLTDLRDLLAKVPRAASVIASETLAPHLAARRRIYRADQGERADFAVLWSGDRAKIDRQMGGRLEKDYGVHTASRDVLVFVRKDILAAGGLLAAEGVEVVDAEQGHGQLRYDHSVDGNPLSIGSLGFPRGLGTHAASRIRLRLPPGTTRLEGACGVDDEVGARGSIRCEIVAGDGAVLFSSGLLRGGMPAQRFAVDARGQETLELVTDPTGDGIDFDHVDWVDLRASR
jgi:uncharacterized membrane protein